jgi:hypothetical protein
MILLPNSRQVKKLVRRLKRTLLALKIFERGFMKQKLL